MIGLFILASLTLLSQILCLLTGNKLDTGVRKYPGARITLSPLVSDIRGTVNDLAFSIWKTGVNYVRGKTNAIQNPQSLGQNQFREDMAELSKNWRADLNDGSRALYDTYAQSSPGMGPSDGGVNELIKGNHGKMSGFNAFILTHQWLRSVGITGLVNAPVGAVAPTQPTNVAVSFAGGTATVTWTTPANAEVGAICRIWGRVEGMKGHVQIIATEAFDTDTKDITTIRGGKGVSFPFTDITGKVLHVQMDTVNPTGGKSAGSNVAQAVIA